MGSATRILCIASYVSREIFSFYARRARVVPSPGTRWIASKTTTLVHPRFLSCPQGFIRKVTYFRGGDTPLSKKLRLGLAFDPLVRVNARLRGISRFSSFRFFLHVPQKNFSFLSVVFSCQLSCFSHTEGYRG